MRLSICVLTLFALAGGCFAANRWSNCGPGGCSVSPGVVYWSWKENPDNANQVDLYQNGVCVGSWFADLEAYYKWDGRDWTQVNQAPVAPPLKKGGLPKVEGKFFFGVDSSRLENQEKFWHNGKETTKGVVMASYQGPCEGGLCDDSQRRHITAIGRDKASYLELKALFEVPEFKEKVREFRVQVYDLSDPIDMEICGPYRLEIDQKFKETGKAVICQDPEFDGKGRVTGVWYGLPKITEGVESLRRVDPNMDPNKRKPVNPRFPPNSPDPLPASVSNVSMSPYLFLSALALSGVGFLRKRGESGNG